jgi:hypothetical protein
MARLLYNPISAAGAEKVRVGLNLNAGARAKMGTPHRLYNNLSKPQKRKREQNHHYTRYNGFKPAFTIMCFLVSIAGI